LIARTKGNPFFLEESVRSLVETEALVGAPGAYRLAQSLLTIQVPATVQAVLAARIERLAEQVDRLAHHAVRGEVWEKAVIYCRQAGMRAESRSAHHEAVACFEQALAALAQLSERRDTLEQAIDLRCDLRNALLPLGEEVQIFDHLHTAEALALAEELGMRPLVAHCHLGLGTLYATTGQHEQARAELSAAIDLYRAMEMTFWLPQAEAALAQVE
jgi:predicted ATPase